MSISDLFSEFKFKPSDLVMLKIDEASFDRMEDLRQMYDKIHTMSYDDFSIIPAAGGVTVGAPLPVIYQIMSRAISENMGGTVTTEYRIDGYDGSKLVCHEDEISPFKALPTVTSPTVTPPTVTPPTVTPPTVTPPAPTVDADSSVNT